MARLDLYWLGGAGGPLVVDIQPDVLRDLCTRAVVPLLPRVAVGVPIAGLNPVFMIEGAVFVMMTQAVASVPVPDLGERVASLDGEYEAVGRALDVLIVGV